MNKKLLLVTMKKEVNGSGEEKDTIAKALSSSDFMIRKVLPGNTISIELNPDQNMEEALLQLKNSDDVLDVEEDIIYTKADINGGAIRHFLFLLSRMFRKTKRTDVLKKKNFSKSDEILINKKLWGLLKIHADESLSNGYLGEDVKIGIIDTGCQSDHINLKDKIAKGANTIGAGAICNKYEDDNGHGTHVSGTICAIGDNGIYGVAPKCKLYIAKALDDKGSGTTSDIVEAIYWCIEQDVKVISMSLGTVRESKIMKRALEEAAKQGIIVVCATGNSNQDVDYPAKFDTTIAVGATTINDKRAWFSNYGRALIEHGVVAPGTNIYSTYIGGKYKYLNGTSMATPHVAAVASVLYSFYPKNKENALKIFKMIRSAADRIVSVSNEEQGAGQVNIVKALNDIVG